jgi:hypothetical protein
VAHERKRGAFVGRQRFQAREAVHQCVASVLDTCKAFDEHQPGWTLIQPVPSLDERGWDAARAAGRQLTQAEAVALALSA